MSEGIVGASSRSRDRPPRRPRRLRGNSCRIASSSTPNRAAPSLISASSAHSSGLRRVARSVSRSRSSGVRERRTIRWVNSLNAARRRAASIAPSVRPSVDSSSRMTAGGGAAAGTTSWRASDWRSRRSSRRWRPRSRSRSRSRSLRSPSGSGAVSAGVLSSDVQSNVRSGWVCSSASMTSGSSKLRPTFRFDGVRNI